MKVYATVAVSLITALATPRLVLAQFADDPALTERCLSILRAGMQAEEFWPSMHAAEALTQAGHGDEVLHWLDGRLDRETDDQKRCGLSREQIRAGKAGLAQVMLDILANKESDGRIHACESLYKVRQTGDGKLLRGALDEGDAVLELMAAAALFRGGDRSMLSRIRAHLSNEDGRTRRVAAWVLGRLGDTSDWEALRKLAKAERDPLSNSFILNALAQLGAPGALGQVVANLKSREAAVRTYAAQTIGDCHAALQLPHVLPLLDDENLDTRLRAAQSVLRITGSDAWVTLFDGKTLNGWRQINGTAKYAVEDGCIVGTTMTGSPNSFLCTTKLYSDFILEFEVKVDPRLNSGVQIRSNSFPDYRNGRVHGYQVEIATSNAGFVYDEARRGKFLDTNMKSVVRQAAYKKNDWNKYRVVFVGDRLRTWVNAQPVADLRDDMTAVGFIGLQVHGFKGDPPAQVRWRGLRLRPLGPVIGSWYAD